MGTIDFGTVTRRLALLTLGGSAITAMGAVPATAKAGANTKAAKKVKKVCKRQGEQCIDLVLGSCGGEPGCIAAQTRCCAFFARCQAGPAFDCFANIGA